VGGSNNDEIHHDQEKHSAGSTGHDIVRTKCENWIWRLKMKLSKERLALIAGMIGCLLYVIGDFLFAAIGKNQSAESIGLMVKVAYLDMATCRMVASIICGVVGTALYYVGFHQMWKLLKRHLTQPKQQKWVKMFQIAYLTGTVCWGYVHAMFMNVALIFKFTFEKYGDMQAAAEIANKVFYCNAAPMLAAYLLCDVLLSVVMLVLIWKGLLPLKTTAQRILASLCNPIAFAGIVGNLFTLLPWPLDQIDHGTESAGHLLVMVLGLVLLREMAKSGECKETVQ